MNKHKSLKYDTEVIEQILSSDSLVIYGAGTMGRAVCRCLTESPYDCRIDCFIVRSLEDNPSSIESANPEQSNDWGR